MNMLKNPKRKPNRVVYERKSLFIFSFFRINIQRIYQKSIQIFSYIILRDRAKWAVMLLLISLVILYAALVPVANNFETDMTVDNVSFNYIGKDFNKTFINNVLDIKSLVITGADALELTGAFTSPDNEEFNKKLKDYKTLKFELLGENSQWEIAPINYQQQQLDSLTIEKLTLQPNASVDMLNFNHKTNQLLLQTNTNLPDNEKILTNNSKNRDNPKSNEIIINLGSQPLRMTLTGYKQPQLSIADSLDAPNPLSFEFQPQIPKVGLSLKKTAKILVDLPEQPENHEHWFRGDIAVNHVRFIQKDITGENLNDTIIKSAILQGEVRMGERELDVNQNQFLMIDEPGIQLIRNLEISPLENEPEVELEIKGEKVKISQPSKGLNLLVAGKTQRIQVGLDPSFPVNTIQSNYLSRLGFPNDIVIAIISVVSAFIVALLGWVVNDFQAYSSSLLSKNEFQ